MEHIPARNSVRHINGRRRTETRKNLNVAGRIKTLCHETNITRWSNDRNSNSHTSPKSTPQGGYFPQPQRARKLVPSGQAGQPQRLGPACLRRVRARLKSSPPLPFAEAFPACRWLFCAAYPRPCYNQRASGASPSGFALRRRLFPHAQAPQLPGGELLCVGAVAPMASPVGHLWRLAHQHAGQFVAPADGTPVPQWWPTLGHQCGLRHKPPLRLPSLPAGSPLPTTA